MSQVSLEMFSEHNSFKTPARLVALVVGVALALLIGVIDYTTGTKTSVLVLYLLPVIFTAWLGGHALGIFIALFCGVIWTSAQFAAEDSIFGSTFEVLQNGIMRTAVFLVVEYLVTQLDRALTSKQDVSRYDVTTGLPNRSAFFYRGAIALGTPEAHDAELALIMVDIDRLHALNTKYSQQRGDLIISLTAHALRAAKRPGDVIARTGGDEFALLMPMTNESTAKQQLAVLRRQLDTVEQLAGCPVTHSVIHVQCQRPPLALEELLNFAEGEIRRTDGLRSISYSENYAGIA